MRLSDAESTLTAAYLDWQRFLANPNFVRRANAITWKGGRTTLCTDTTWDDVAIAADNHDYSFQVAEDGSLLQLYYLFADNERLDVASLSFISSVPYSDADTDALVPWLRIDYAPTAAAGPTHHTCHLHLSIGSQVRVPVSRIPSPAQFIELVVTWFYPQVYNAHRMTGGSKWPGVDDINRVNERRIAIPERPSLDGLPHISVP